MLCTTSSSAASDSGHGTDGGTTTGSKWSKLNEADLLDVLKNYYRLCRQCQDKRSMIKDSTLIQLLGALLTDKRPSIAVYICKILLSLSERPEDAKALADIQQLRDQMNKALSIEDENVAVQPRIYSKLLVIQTRITNPTAGTSPKDKFTKKSKQLVFAFDPPTESQRKDMERKCCQMPGVVSVCFQTNDPNETRCLIRCSETVEDKAIIRALISAGNLEMVKQFVRVRGFEKTDVFEFYASQLDQEDREAKKKESLPKYLDDDPQLFDPTQCIATKEQVGAQNNGEGWFSTIKTFLW